MQPTTLYHVTTPAKARRYAQTGAITRPVRGFDTLSAAKAWAWKTGRTIIYEIPAPPSLTHKLPDHHNRFGFAWWVDCDVPMRSARCVLSPERAERVGV